MTPLEQAMATFATNQSAQIAGRAALTKAAEDAVAPFFAKLKAIKAERDNPPEPLPAENGFTVSIAPAVMCWVLAGPAGFAIDALLASAINAGLGADCIAPGSKYRLTGNNEWIAGYAAGVAKLLDHSLTQEQAPSGALNLSATVAPVCTPRRVTHVHGGNNAAYSLAARAVDHGLRVTAAGINRWAVTGSSAVQMRWLAAATGKAPADVLKEWNTTADAIAAEDAHGVEVTVSLPTREITTDLMNRDDRGNLTKVVQTERTV